MLIAKLDLAVLVWATGSLPSNSRADPRDLIVAAINVDCVFSLSDAYILSSPDHVVQSGCPGSRKL